MKKRFSGILAAGLIFSAAAAFGAVKEGQFSVSPVLGGYTYEGGQHFDTNLLYGLRAGYNFTKNVGAEALFDYVNTDFTRTKDKLDMYRYGGELLYHFMPDNNLVPYIAGGLAAQNFKNINMSSSPRLAFDYGAGLKYFVTEAVALRGDVRHIIYQNNNSKTYNNLEYTLGAHFPFGGKTPVAKAVEPPPAPAPAKVAPPEPAPAKAAPPAPKAETPKPAPVESPKKVAAAQRFCNKPAVLNILFDFDKSNIKPEFHNELKTVGEFLNDFPTSKGVIEGHTDSKGSKQYNQKLSLRRAESVRNYIIKNFGIKPERLDFKGYGEDKPVADNKTKEGRAKNRRTVTNFSCE